MPIYEFHCGKCGEDSEILVRSSDRKTRCPHCGSAKLAKKFSVFASSNGAEDPGCKANRGGCCACASGRPHKH